MPKAASSTASKKEEKQVSEAAFLKSLNKKKAVLKAAAKTKRREGYQDDEAIAKRLGLEPGESGTFNASVSKIGFSFAKNDANRPMFRFSLVIMSSNKKANGTVVSWNHILEEGRSKETDEVFRTELEAAEAVMADFQGLGEDTTEWDEDEVMEKALEAAKYHTKEKTEVSLYIKHWTKTNDKGEIVKAGLNYRINGPIDDDEGTEEDEEQEEEELEEEETEEEETEETEEEESEEESEESEEESEEGEFDPDEWIGGYVTFKDKEFGNVRMKVTAYNEKKHAFEGIDQNGDVWDGKYAVSVDKVEYDDNQDDE